MKCTQCGCDLPDGTVFCGNCGAQQNATPAGQNVNQNNFAGQNLGQGAPNGGYAPNQNGYNQNGYNQNGYNQNGYNQNGYNQNGYNQNGYNQNGYNQNGYNQNGYNQNGYNQNGYNPNGYNPNGFNQGGYIPNKQVSFGDAIKLFFTNYVNFSGRSCKAEYWWAVLFNFLVSLVAGFIPYLGSIISLGLMIPGLSLSIRRLHDIGKAWYWILMGLIPLAGPIILIVYYCKDSVGDNQWGPRPR